MRQLRKILLLTNLFSYWRNKSYWLLSHVVEWLPYQRFREKYYLNHQHCVSVIWLITWAWFFWNFGKESPTTQRNITERRLFGHWHQLREERNVISNDQNMSCNNFTFDFSFYRCVIKFTYSFIIIIIIITRDNAERLNFNFSEKNTGPKRITICSFCYTWPPEQDSELVVR
jgi:hypothetical protein